MPYSFAASTARSGVYGFPSDAERDDWVAVTPGAFAVPRSTVDPDIRREFEEG